MSVVGDSIARALAKKGVAIRNEPLSEAFDRPGWQRAASMASFSETMRRNEEARGHAVASASRAITD